MGPGVELGAGHGAGRDGLESRVGRGAVDDLRARGVRDVDDGPGRGVVEEADGLADDEVALAYATRE